MELHYDLTYDDRLALQRHHVRRLTAVQRSLPYRAVIVAAIVVVYVLFRLAMPADTSPTGATILFGATLCVFAFLLGLAGLVRKAMIGRIAKKELYGGGETEHVRLALEPEAVVSESQWSAGRILWGALRQIEEAQEHIFISVGAGEVLIIPKRAFESAQHMQAFLDEVDRLRAVAAGAASAANSASDSASPSLQ